MRPAVRRATALLLTALLVVALGAPTAAAGVAVPDALIGVQPTFAPVGDAIFNRTGADQSRSATAKPGHEVLFLVTLQNNGDGDGKLHVKAPVSGHGYTVRYVHGETDVTTAVVKGTFTTRKLRPGDADQLLIHVKVTKYAAQGSRIKGLVKVTGTGADPAVDAVGFSVARA